MPKPSRGWLHSWFGNGAQLVLLDHGMYRSLSDDYRRSYSRLWVALLTQDHVAGREAAQRLGVPSDDYDTLAVALTFRPPSSRAPIGHGMSQADRQALRARYATVDATEVNRFLRQLPREMTMVMRTWGLVRSLNRALGGTTRERFLTMATYAARGAVIRSAGGEGTGGSARHGTTPVTRWLRDLVLVGHMVWRGCVAWGAVVWVQAWLAVELAQSWAVGRLSQGTEGLLAPGARQYG
jgi:aarF domain-containing kinase